MGYSPWSEREIWPNFKNSKIFETREATATKIGFHVFYFNLYLHEFFDSILLSDLHGQEVESGLQWSPWSKGKLCT